MASPITKKEAFRKYRKKEGHYHKADPAHPMNSERTGPPRKDPPKPRKPNPERVKRNPKRKNLKRVKKLVGMQRGTNEIASLDSQGGSE